MNVNKEHLAELRDVLRNEHKMKEIGLAGFDMSSWVMNKSNERTSYDEPVTWCGTAACIGGTCDIMTGHIKIVVPSDNSYSYADFPHDNTKPDAYEYLLGADATQGDHDHLYTLFYPTVNMYEGGLTHDEINWSDYEEDDSIQPTLVGHPWKATAEQAARVVDNIIKTGVVDWRVMIDDNYEFTS